MHQSLAIALAASGAADTITVHESAAGWELETAVGAASSVESPAIRSLHARHTNRLPYRSDPVTWLHPTQSWPGSSQVRFIKDRGAIAEVAAATRLCSAARFNSRELHEWLFSSLRWTDQEAARGEGLDMATLHLPPGGRQFMRFIAPWSRMERLNCFGLYHVMAAADTKLVAQAPVLVAISGGGDSASVWEAGRAMQQIWVQLNAAGYAVHPYYVIPDLANRLVSGQLAPKWHAEVRQALALVHESCGFNNGESLHILLRVGLPTQPAIRSRRLPIEQLIAQD
jgi:hypothetical protein